MKMSKQTIGHVAAMVTILIWGTTFISTKILLEQFQPVEILFFRFMIGFLALWLIYPHRLQHTTKQQEFMFVLAGLCGICLYYLLENIALTYTSTANVGVIISIAPFFTALLTQILWKDRAIHGYFFVGFVMALLGIGLISMQGSTLELNPFGDVLAIAAAFVWACYSMLTKKISSYGYSTILTTRRTFFYGLLWMIPVICLSSFQLGLERFYDASILGHILFLGLGASALCFITWNFAVKQLGPVKTSVYIYMVPVITVTTSMIVLQEVVTPLAWLGILFTLIGLGLSQRNKKETSEMNKQNLNNR